MEGTLHVGKVETDSGHLAHFLQPVETRPKVGAPPPLNSISPGRSEYVYSATHLTGACLCRYHKFLLVCAQS